MRFSGRNVDGVVTGGQLAVRFKSAHILDAGVVQAIRDEVLGAVNKHRVNTIILNFAGVKQMSSQMLGTVLHLKKLMEKGNGHLRVCCLKGEAKKAFKLCGFHKLITVYKSEEKALAAE